MSCLGCYLIVSFFSCKFSITAPSVLYSFGFVCITIRRGSARVGSFTTRKTSSTWSSIVSIPWGTSSSGLSCRTDKQWPTTSGPWWGHLALELIGWFSWTKAIYISITSPLKAHFIWKWFISSRLVCRWLLTALCLLQCSLSTKLEWY